MNVYFTPKAGQKLASKLDWLKGPGLKALADRVTVLLIEGNRRDRLSGVDWHGRPQTPVKPRRGKYKNAMGPPLAPFGAQSRVVKNFRAAVKGSPGRFEVIAGWENVVSKSGVPFLPFHEHGATGGGKGSKGKAAPKRGFFGRILAKVGLGGKAKSGGGGGGWHLPARPIFGISPTTWRAIDGAVAEFKRSPRG